MKTVNQRTTQKPADIPAGIAAAGRLTETPARAILEHLNLTRFSGRLTLEYREKKKKLWFFNGDIFRVQSNLAPELLGQMLVDRNYLNEESLKDCLQKQSELEELTPIGQLAHKFFGINERTIDNLHLMQKVRGIIQALTWDEGTYELSQHEFKEAPEKPLAIRSFFQSMKILLESTEGVLGPLFNVIKPWEPQPGSIHLSEFPVYAIIAGCRLVGSNGILSIRRKNRLYEIVFKHGVPLTLYEGTFGQPRQTILVRQASEEHERFFIEQVFKLFSFLTGSAHFRPLNETKEISNALREPGDSTRVVSEKMKSSFVVILKLKSFLMQRYIQMKRWMRNGQVT